MMMRALLLVSVTVLSACTSLPPPESTPAPVENREVTPSPSVLPPPAPLPVPTEPSAPVIPVEPEPVPPPPRAATPSSTLLASVDTAMASGQFEQAAALCERALRISPRDGHLWYRLATIRYKQNRFADAAGLARRAMSFAGPDAKLADDSRKLLQQAESRN